MVSKRAKIHHYVPQGLQRQFLDQDSQIWYAERNEIGKFGRPEKRNTKSTFKQRDYYTVFEEGKQTDRVETQFYGVLDNWLSNFLTDIHSLLDQGKDIKVEDDSLINIRRVVYHLLVRTPEFAKSYDDYQIGKEFLEDIVREAKERGFAKDDIVSFEQELADRNHVVRQGRTIRVKGQISPSDNVFETLDKLVVRFADIRGKQSFILSSRSVYRIGNGGSNGLNNPNAEIWLPISPKRALVLLRDDNGWIPLVIVVDRDQVRQINEYGVRNSEKIASHSEPLLRSLIANTV
jgi:hypothetical protein